MATTVVNLRDEPDRGSFAYIGRPGPFGNPFVIGEDGDRAEVVAKFRAWFAGRVATDAGFRRQVESLRGRRLGCFCAPLACHGDVIAEWLDRG